jgi:hypothetical protein
VDGLEKFGISSNYAPTSAPTELHSVATPSRLGADQARLLSPENPLFWFGVLGLLTFGAMAFSTEAKVGTLHVSASAGK